MQSVRSMTKARMASLTPSGVMLSLAVGERISNGNTTYMTWLTGKLLVSLWVRAIVQVIQSQFAGFDHHWKYQQSFPFLATTRKMLPSFPCSRSSFKCCHCSEFIKDIFVREKLSFFQLFWLSLDISVIWHFIERLWLEPRPLFMPLLGTKNK